MRSAAVVSVVLLSIACGGVGIAGPPTLEDVERCSELDIPDAATVLDFSVEWGMDCRARIVFDLPDPESMKTFASSVGCAPGSVVDEKGRPLPEFSIPSAADDPAWWKAKPGPSRRVRGCSTDYNGEYGRSLLIEPRGLGASRVYLSHFDI